MYDYQKLKPEILTDEGQRLFLKIRDKVNALLKQAGAVRMQEAINGFSGETWLMLACVDRMVELKELRELTEHANTAGQYRVFVNYNCARVL